MLGKVYCKEKRAFKIDKQLRKAVSDGYIRVTDGTYNMFAMIAFGGIRT
jgi:hypothetical protein